jgi:sec-independent protein translocase protein TatB
MATPQIIELGILGWSDSLILMVMALVVFGPRRLPEIGRQIGKLMYEFRKASNDFKFQMEEELRLSEESDRRKKEEERLRTLAAAAPSTPTEPVTAANPTVPDAEAAAPVAAALPPEESATQDEGTEKNQTGELRIHPPSTGEPIPAARPGSQAAQAAAELAAQSEDAKIEAKPDDLPAPEHANQNG